MGVKEGVYFWEEPVMQAFAPEEVEDGPEVYVAGESNVTGELDAISEPDAETTGDGMADGTGALDGEPDSGAVGAPQSADGEASGGAQSANDDAADGTEAVNSSTADSNVADTAQSAGSDATGAAADQLPLQFERVEEDYFDDALFIGDSRTQGMLEYGGLEDRADFYC